MTITEYYLKAESLSSMVQDRIAVFLADRKFVDFDEIIKGLLRRSEREVRELVKSLLFVQKGVE